MRNVWIILFGVLLMALSGLERIILYASKANQVGNNLQELTDLIPSYIWNITTITFFAGILLVGIGAMLYLPNRSKDLA
ncbi:hypothetical protein J2Z69_002581 [Paenibacillus shirakamiensis]|uniref:Uncharacterized protein n=1 Tax=Paenibacillus shirakamiensis TaxID=1265935 RepID=A0ABS4JKN1_9BACL|nr:hypothetical protein [Paenibacillus shirakamiensis]MBP2001536.1 hypothetical protein [Paenibacillus shirakamiensis]